MKSTELRHVIVASSWVLAAVLLGLAVPKCVAIFQDFGVPLPRTTLLVVAASRPGWIWLPLALLPIVLDFFVSGAETDEETTQAFRVWSILVLVIPLVLIGAVLWALALPFFTIMTRLSG